jgi:hypothetical protein
MGCGERFSGFMEDLDRQLVGNGRISLANLVDRRHRPP